MHCWAWGWNPPESDGCTHCCWRRGCVTDVGWSCLLSQDAVVEMLSQGYRVDSQVNSLFSLGAVGKLPFGNQMWQGKLHCNDTTIPYKWTFWLDIMCNLIGNSSKTGRLLSDNPNFGWLNPVWLYHFWCSNLFCQSWTAGFMRSQDPGAWWQYCVALGSLV